VAELIRYRLRHERYIVRAGESRIQTRYGEFRMIAYESEVNGGESHIALVRGDLCEGLSGISTRAGEVRAMDWNLGCR
jgi:3,4-dihydroxy 2-butanone 4-phosphate synthase / GTP cyclohydrolase II